MADQFKLETQGLNLFYGPFQALKDQVLRELLTYMISDPRSIERALALILIARHLERIGDHSVNIAEDVIYLIQGRDVRHPRLPKEPPPA